MAKRPSVFLTLFALLPAFSLSAQEFTFEQATVNWQDTDTYRDVRAVDQSQSRFKKQTFEILSQEFASTAEQNLNPEQVLKVTVTDLDLAGEARYRPELGREMRVLTNITPPRITFRYQVLEGETIIKQGDEKISDLNYLSSVMGSARDRRLAYEKKLIQNWGKKNL